VQEQIAAYEKEILRQLGHTAQNGYWWILA
jgi:hypothetical protein